MNRAGQVHTTGFDLPDPRMVSAVPQPSAVARITLARHTCFWWCAAIRNDRLKPEAICSRDVDDNSCSHNESLDCALRFSKLICSGEAQGEGAPSAQSFRHFWQTSATLWTAAHLVHGRR